MNKIKSITLVLMSLLMYSCNGNAQEKSSSSTSENKIEVIDFHSTHRCKTCNAIEANTKFTLETYFAKELESGIITFQSINIDEEKNYAMAEKFEASGTSLFINVIIDGDEKIFNLTNIAFQKGRDQEVFSKVLKDKINRLLKKL